MTWDEDLNVMDDGSPHNWTQIWWAEMYYCGSTQSRPHRRHSFQLFWLIFNAEGWWWPLIILYECLFHMELKIGSYRSRIRQISQMLPMRPQRQTGRGEGWASVSAMITFCSGPVAVNRNKIRLRPQNMNFISAMHPDSPFLERACADTGSQFACWSGMFVTVSNYSSFWLHSMLFVISFVCCNTEMRMFQVLDTRILFLKCCLTVWCLF